MIFYHHGAAVQASAVRVGNAFVARALIQTKDGVTDSLLDLGLFANRSAAMQFAIRSARLRRRRAHAASTGQGLQQRRRAVMKARYATDGRLIGFPRPVVQPK